jgi:hypothetical protein
VRDVDFAIEIFAGTRDGLVAPQDELPMHRAKITGEVVSC